MNRREFTGTLAVSLLAGCTAQTLGGIKNVEEAYGIIGQMKVADGMRGAVIAAMLEGTKDLPGNIAYMIAEDIEDPNSFWITEVWQTKTDHANSLNVPSVQEAIGKARPHITGFGTRVETKPILRG